MPPLASPNLPAALDTVDTVVAGAGVVGLACARALAQAGREVLVLEAAGAFGTVTSARSSEVVHAGLYYPAGSLKARLCVAGRHALVAYCTERGIARRGCGKLVVATAEAQRPALEALAAQARANGVDDVALVDGPAARALEPALGTGVVAALHSPSTGIVDSHALMQSLLADAQAAGALLALRTPLVAARADERGFELETGGAQPMRLRARRLVNAAGLDAPALAARIAGLAPRHVPRAHYCKGSWFALAGRAPFARLVYPVPEPGGLGVHLTLDLAGQARFGPDVEWLPDDTDTAAIDYAVDPARGARFADAIRRYWPALPDGALVPAHAGVRPKLAGPGEPAADFRVDGPTVHGVDGLANLFGIESPGLTAALAIGQEVSSLLDGDDPPVSARSGWPTRSPGGSSCR